MTIRVSLKRIREQTQKGNQNSFKIDASSNFVLIGKKKKKYFLAILLP